VFAAFTGPDGGLTSICNFGDKLAASMLQVRNLSEPRNVSVFLKTGFDPTTHSSNLCSA
jgi:hypothetical protein